MSLLTLLRGAALIGAFIWTIYLVVGWSAYGEMKSFSMFPGITQRALNAMLIQTGVVIALYIFGFFGKLIAQCFEPTDEEKKKAEATLTNNSNKSSSNTSQVNTIKSNTREIQSDTRECPFCAETIKAAAKMCRFCKSPLNPTEILQNEQNDLQNFSRSNFSDEDYLQNNIYRKINHQSLIYYKLPNSNYVVYSEAKYYIFDDKDKFDRALKQYESTSFLSEEYCLRVIDEQQTSILKKIASNLEIEQAKNRWK
jgi:hypothetical protein